MTYLTWSYHRARRFEIILGPFSFSLCFSPESSYELATGDTSRWYSLFIGLFVMVSGIRVGGFILSGALTGLIEDIRSVVILLADGTAVAAFAAARRDETVHLDIYVHQGDLSRFGTCSKSNRFDGAHQLIVLAMREH